MMPAFRFSLILTSRFNTKNYKDLDYGNENYRKCIETAIALGNRKQYFVFLKDSTHAHCELAWARLHKTPVTVTGIRTCTRNLSELH